MKSRVSLIEEDDWQKQQVVSHEVFIALVCILFRAIVVNDP